MLQNIFIFCLVSCQAILFPLVTALAQSEYNEIIFHNLSTSAKIAHDSRIVFKGDIGKQNEDAVNLSFDFLPNPSRLISAVKDRKGRLRICSWLVKEDGSIFKRGDNGKSNDEVRVVDVVSHNGHILTAIRLKDNKGFLVSWYLHRADNSDSIVEVDRASVFDGEVSSLRVEAVFRDMYITSFRDHIKEILYLVSWRIKPDGSITKLSTVNSGVQSEGITILHLEHPYTSYVVTGFGDNQGKLKIFLWHFSYTTGAITMAGSSSSIGAPSTSETRLVTIGGRIYSSYRTADDELKVIGWEINQNTLNIVPTGHTGERSGTIEKHGLVSFHDFSGRDRLISAIRTGSDKVALVDWIVNKNKKIIKNNELVLSKYSPHPKFGILDLHIISHPFAQLILAFRDKSSMLKIASWGVF